jgi:hypothetical protein
MFGKESERTQRRLLERGVRAPATVLEIADHGMTISTGVRVAATEVVLKTRLRVEPPGRPAFEVERKLRFEQLSVPKEGAQIAVIFDPEDHGTLMLDPEASHSLLAETRQLAERGRELAANAAATRSMIQEMLAAKGLGAPGAARPAAPDPVAELERLGSLRERGLLTDEEFTAAKARILGT